MKAHNSIEMISKKFSMLLILHEVDRINIKRPRYKCLCDCGNISLVEGRHLRGKKIISCGCFAKKRMGEISKTHGMTNSSEYKTWCGIKRRCLNKNDSRFHYYGGRGIEICEEWKFSFEKFFSDMGEKPSKTSSIERINCNGNYSKENCIWLEISLQQINKRSNVILTLNDETMILAQWARKLGIRAETISARLRNGWSVEDALSKPLCYPKRCHDEL